MPCETLVKIRWTKHKLGYIYWRANWTLVCCLTILLTIIIFSFFAGYDSWYCNKHYWRPTCMNGEKWTCSSNGNCLIVYVAMLRCINLYCNNRHTHTEYLNSLYCHNKATWSLTACARKMSKSSHTSISWKEFFNT